MLAWKNFKTFVITIIILAENRRSCRNTLQGCHNGLCQLLRSQRPSDLVKKRWQNNTGQQKSVSEGQSRFGNPQLNHQRQRPIPLRPQPEPGYPGHDVHLVSHSTEQQAGSGGVAGLSIQFAVSRRTSEQGVPERAGPEVVPQSDTLQGIQRSERQRDCRRVQQVLPFRGVALQDGRICWTEGMADQHGDC